MSKQEILDYFSEINYAYNDAGRLDSLSHMLDELLEDITEEIIRKKCHQGDPSVAYGLELALDTINNHINGKEQK